MSRETILIADDDRAIRTVLSQALIREGYVVRAASDGTTLLRWVEEGLGDLVITDVIMPDMNGLDLLPRLNEARPGMNIIVMSAQNTLMTAVKAAQRGAFEYLPKPFDLASLIEAASRAIRASGATQSGAEKENGLDQAMAESATAMPLIGRSPAMQHVYRVISRLVNTDLTVLISGASGTGKELVARALHDLGQRQGGPFVAINMAAIPRDLVESDLFGHEKGAFTGALQKATGRFEQARGGTLFLDEIGDMPLEAQTRLLRVLQEGEFTTVGGRVPIAADARIVAATHQDLRTLIREGKFREDLYYRLNVVPITMPALRERTEDIPDLVQHFSQSAAAPGCPPKTFTREALARLKHHDWPGNVRELENLVQRLNVLYAEETIDAPLVMRELHQSGDNAQTASGTAVRSSAGPVGPEPEGIMEETSENLSAAVSHHLKAYFMAHDGELPADGLYPRILNEVERPLIELSLAATGGNQIRAAQLLGLNRNTLRKKIRALEISVTKPPK